MAESASRILSFRGFSDRDERPPARHAYHGGALQRDSSGERERVCIVVDGVGGGEEGGRERQRIIKQESAKNDLLAAGGITFPPTLLPP